MRRKLIAGNWKMNGLASSLAEIDRIAAHPEGATLDMVICPPATLLDRARTAIGAAPLALGGQDCHARPHGAHTGDLSAEMLVDSGASYVILGHSERRADHGETDHEVADKTRAAWGAGLAVILCVGETLAEREAGHTLDVISRQLAHSAPDGASAASLAIAYEPVWAIGTGHVATTAQIAEVHAALRHDLVARFGPEAGADMRLLYGGSVKPDNAAEVFAVENVDGALVGGASLTADSFSQIVDALARA